MGSSQKHGKPSKPDQDAASTAPDDVVVVYSPTVDGRGARVLRKRGDELSVGEVRPLEHGQPIHGDVVSLERRPEHPALFDVRTEYAAPSSSKASSPASSTSSGATSSGPDSSEHRSSERTRLHAGPARASSDRYRDGWESLWGRRQRRKTEKPN